MFSLIYNNIIIFVFNLFLSRLCIICLKFKYNSYCFIGRCAELNPYYDGEVCMNEFKVSFKVYVID